MNSSGKEGKILLVEDDLYYGKILSNELKNAKWDTLHAKSGEEALLKMGEQFDVMLLDLNLPGMNGLELLQSIAGEADLPEVVVLTGSADIGHAVEAMKLGAYDFLQKPVPMEKLFLVLKKAAEKRRLRLRNLLLEKKANRNEEDISQIIVKSRSMEKTFELAQRVAGEEVVVLLLGETGTGKDVLAKFIHQKSEKANGPFISLNCASFQKSMLENELFGHEKGAFTDAQESKPGFFEVAFNGTVFLDEIGEMPLDMQAKLLHVIENKAFYRVGGTRMIRSNTRLITATNQNLEDLVKKGSFRQDLFFRINMFSIMVPPLRIRGEEIVPLAEFFLREVSPGKVLEERAKEVLLGYQWPGNVRELKHVIQRAAIVSDQVTVGPEHLSINSTGGFQKPRGDDLEMDRRLTLNEVEGRYIRKILDSLGWKKGEAARVLGIDPKTLYRKIRMYGLSPGDS